MIGRPDSYDREHVCSVIIHLFSLVTHLVLTTSVVLAATLQTSVSNMAFTTSALSYSVLITLAVYVVYRRFFRFSVKHIRGPEPSFWQGMYTSYDLSTSKPTSPLAVATGNLRTFFFQSNVGDLDFKYVKEYGLVWRMNGPLGVCALSVGNINHLSRSNHAYSKMFSL